MVEEKDLNTLIEQDIVRVDKNGIRRVDASRLPATKKTKKPQEDVVSISTDLEKKEKLIEHFENKEFIMSEEEIPKGVGLDVGTSFLVASRFGADGKIHFKKFRDCFLELEPKSSINRKFIKKGLDDRKAPYIEKDGNFFVLGEDAFLMANERHVNTRRPMHRGVLAPQEKQAFPILKELISRLVGEPTVPGERLIFSVPAKPIDADFDQLFHQDMLRSFINSLGYTAQPMNEAEALAYSELLEDGLTGIAVSCLVPGTKIYANYGIKNIEDVESGDLVITHKGRPRKVTNVMTKEFSGKKTKLQIQGYSNSTEDYQFVDNHELYVYRNNEWQWVGCEEIIVGDLVGEPVVEEDPNQKVHTMSICEKITSSPELHKRNYSVTQDVFRLMGYFLTDGSVNLAEGCIQFDFHKDEKENIEDVQKILQSKFEKHSALIKKGENAIRIKCYSRGLTQWFSNHCFDNKRDKFFPWSLERMSDGDCAHLLAGLIRGDGVIGKDRLDFENTSTNLIWLTKQLFSRLGMGSSISYRAPRAGGVVEGRLIKGKKTSWQVRSGGSRIHRSVLDLVTNLSCSDTIAEKITIRKGFCCGIVQKIEYENYSGTVYDLQVEEDHSFSGPMLTIHNCGAGMMNVAVLSSGETVLTFSTSKSGDWVDQQAAIATNMTHSVIQQEKESPDLDLIHPEPGNQIQAAISVYYGNLLVYTLEQIAYDLGRSSALPKFKDPIPLVVGGGTSLPKGFIEKFKQALGAVQMPVRISEVRHANDPLYSVANGLALAASMD